MKTAIKKLLALTLAVIMGIGLIACGQSGGGQSGQSGDEIEEIVFTYYVNSTIANDLQKVQDAINEITEKEINVRVILQPISLGVYNQQINLMLSSGERMDLFGMSGSLLANYVALGQCIPIDDLLAEYGQGILENVGNDFLKGGRVGGVTYGVMPMRDIAQGRALYIRKDYVEKYNLDLSAIKTMADVEPVLAAIKAAEPDMYPLVIEKNDTLTPVELCSVKDNVGDGYGVLKYAEDPYTVVNYYASEEYKEAVELMRKWYLAGYISPDVTTNTENIATQMKAGKGVCYFYTTKTGMDAQESKANNHEMVHADIVTPYISTFSAQLLTYGIAQQSEHPEAAMKFLNLLYTNKDVLNLLDWGIEGEHYVFTEDGHITYPEGVDATNSGYNVNMTWAFGYTFNSHIWEGNSLTMWEDSKAALKNSAISPTMGFTYDSTPVTNEVAALANVTAEFRLGLETGSMDPSNLATFIEKLEEAGIDNVMAEKQKQLDEWRKNN